MSTCTEYRLGGNAGDRVPSADIDPPSGDNEAGHVRPNVLIYRNELIERSETFILSQATAMRRYRGVFCGLSRKSGGILPKDAGTCLLVPDLFTTRLTSFLRTRAFMTAGFAPGWKTRFDAFQPVLVHAHFSIDGAFALPLMDRLEVPLVVSLHGYDVTRSDDSFCSSAGGRLYLRRRKQLFARADLFLCVSRFIRDQAIQRGYPPDKLWVHSIGIDVEAFQAADVAERRPIVLFVGRLVEKKGCAHLIAAMRSVQQAMPETRLVIIGDGPLRQQLEAQAACSLPGTYTFLGAQSVHTVHSWLKQAMVFCVPSVTAANGDREGLGMVFCEAQAMGVPVVSFASGGIPEAVVNGATGFLSPEHDETGLARGISRLLQDRDCWAEMSRKGQQRIKHHFNLTSQTALLEAKYEEVTATVSRRTKVLRCT